MVTPAAGALPVNGAVARIAAPPAGDQYASPDRLRRLRRAPGFSSIHFDKPRFATYLF
jgi:hypothetical protein